MQPISVILPTRAIPSRHALFRRAVESVVTQEGVRAIPLVVINGPDRDPGIEQEILRDRRVRAVVHQTNGLPAALLEGRVRVDTPLFAELDDDDFFLPGALRARVALLDADGGAEVVISNGIRRGPEGDGLQMEDVAEVERDPVRALTRANWLLPGAWLCRTDAVDASIFEDIPPHLECTYLALRFALSCRIRFLAQPTVVWHMEMPDSITRSREYVLGQVPALQRIIALDLPPDVRARFRRKLAGACHDIAVLFLREGKPREAWTWHARSVREPGGLRHLGFTVRVWRALRGA